MRVAAELTERLFEQLRTCSGGAAECVAYLTVAQAEPDLIDDVVHAVHESSDDHYVVDAAWLNRLFIELVDGHRSIVAQVHTHPGDWVEHSWIDDAYPIVPMPGLLSVVVPRHAIDPDPATFGVHRLQPDGTWIDAIGAISW
jgi:hypothetical protein